MTDVHKEAPWVKEAVNKGLGYREAKMKPSECKHEGDAMELKEARRRINEYETLKATVEFLKGDDDGTERCFDCGSMVEQVWHASDEHWTKLSGYTQGDGVLCSRCFDRKARERGVYLYWSCQLDSFPANILEGKDE